MDNERFLVSTPLDDECDTVTYAQGKHKKYYDPDSKRYRIMDNKEYTKLWNDVDYYKLAEGDKDIMCALLILLSNINYDSAVVRYDKHFRTRIQIRSRKELAELLHIDYSSGWQRQKLAKLFKIGLIFETTAKLDGGKSFHTYYLNPLIGMRNKGISLDCYVHFRELLQCKLSKRAIKNLDRHVLESYSAIPKALTEEDYMDGIAVCQTDN